MSPRTAAIPVALGALLLAGALVVIASPGPAPAADPAPPAAAPGPRGVVRIRRPAGPPRVDTGRRDARGEPITAACSTCHATRAPAARRGAEGLGAPHAGLSFAHGTLSCLACHHAGDYDALRLADGEAVPFPDVMKLCAQCHGPQHRDYTHGSHGGMTGYWDLSRGDRDRNGCTDCHDPHAPAFRQVRPVFPPRGRRPPSEGARHD